MLDVEQVYHKLAAYAGLVAIKATWVEQYVRSPITFWCHIHAPEELKDSVDPFVQHLFEVGQQHQTNVTAVSYPGAVQEIFFVEEDGFRRTLELMAQGEKFIKNMPLLCHPTGLEGRPDVLERVDGVESDFGPFSYAVVEIKSARHITEAHLLQGAVYNRLLGMVQGWEPDQFYVVNRDSESQTVRMADYAAKLDDVLDNMRSIMDGAHIDPCHGAGEWPWATYVDQMAKDQNDVSLIPGVGPAKRQSLTTMGFKSVNDVAAADELALVNVKGVGLPTAKRLISSAKSIQQGTPVMRGAIPGIRRGRTEVFFDLEGTDPRIAAEGLEVVNYLIGALVRRPKEKPIYVPFFATTLDEEGRILGEFLSWVASLDDPVLYHWHHYERTHLTKMTDHYGFAATQVNPVLERLVDLSPITTKSFAFPTYGEGLKDIAKSLGFAWRQDDVTALTSVGLYLGYVRSGGNDHHARQKILDYNEDDCLATMHVFDWLLSQVAG